MNFWEADPVAEKKAPVAANFWDHDPVAEKPSVIEDVAKSGGIGLVKGTIGLAGMPGDAGSLASKGAEAVASRAGISPETVAAGKRLFASAADSAPARLLLPGLGFLRGPTSEDITKKVEGVTGEFYKPKTVAGEYAQTVGEFVPGVLGGGEGLLTKALTRVAAPALASETAGQITKGTEAEPYARVAGAVAGGGLASTLSRAKPIAAPTTDELRDSYLAGISHPDVKAVTVHPDALENLHSTIRADLEKRGFRARRESSTFDDLGELSNSSPTMARAAGAPATIDDIESIRKSLGKTAQELGPDFRPTSDAAAATAAVRHIDRWLDNLQQPDLLSGSASRAAPLMKNARADYAAAMRAENLQSKVDNAALNAGSSYSGGNINNATRQALKPLAKNDFAKAGGYSDAEKEQLSKAIMGSFLGNTARSAGKLAPDSGWKALHHIGGAFATGGASIPASLATLAAKLGGDYATTRSVRRLDTMLRERSPLHQQNVASTTSPMLPSPTLPGVMINNPNYVPSIPRQSGGQRALIDALLASTASRLPAP